MTDTRPVVLGGTRPVVIDRVPVSIDPLLDAPQPIPVMIAWVALPSLIARGWVADTRDFVELRLSYDELSIVEVESRPCMLLIEAGRLKFTRPRWIPPESAA